jgi:hypothetical protein
MPRQGERGTAVVALRTGDWVEHQVESWSVGQDGVLELWNTETVDGYLRTRPVATYAGGQWRSVRWAAEG